MIVIYCSTFGLRCFYNVSALLLIISGMLTTDNAVRIQVAQLKRLSSEGRFFFVIRGHLLPLTNCLGNEQYSIVQPIAKKFAERCI